MTMFMIIYERGSVGRGAVTSADVRSSSSALAEPCPRFLHLANLTRYQPRSVVLTSRKSPDIKGITVDVNGTGSQMMSL